ncbi:MAG: CPBP family intramembrane metalloprotease [Deltaproteobacteria bacterium]|nr:CPBP family intramembrane metalloprotease [Deltaproteobacteria bacterium]MBW1871059.1 CPBP family intramembrane metalloprotease [Deltaproteobacteria bacterium]
MILIFYGILLGVALLWSGLRGDPGLFLRPNQSDLFPLLAVAIGVGSGLFLAWLSFVTSRYFSWARRLEAEFARILGRLSFGQVAAIALASSIAEEAFFRGAMQPTLGLVLTSLIFGCLHIGPTRTFISWTIMATLMGFVLGLLYLWTATLLAPILCHLLINAINLHRISLKAQSGSLDRPLQGP